MKISNIQGLRNFIHRNSGFSQKTVNSVIQALGYPLNGSSSTFCGLSSNLENCAFHSADSGFCGFIYHSETIPFFITNRWDIVKHMENMAAELGIDIISMVQGFGVFRYGNKPTAGEVGKALYDSGRIWPKLTTLYNVFAWYTLEEISHTWYRYLEDNPAMWEQLSA